MRVHRHPQGHPGDAALGPLRRGRHRVAGPRARRDVAAAELGIGRAYGSYDELLADADVEAVYIPLPNHLHAEWTRRAAAAGKHVLCEKPLAMNAAEARDMIAACERAGVVLMEAFMYRLHPMWRQVRALVDGGAVGELLAIQAFFSYRNVDPDNIRNIAAFGGGAVMDIGCYPINVARWMFDGEPDGVVATVRRDPALRHRRPDVGRPRLRRPPGDVHVLDADRGRPAGPPRRHGRSAAGGDPVQHPARPSDAHRACGGRRSAGRARPRDHRGADGRPVRRAGRRVLRGGAGRHRRSDPAEPTRSATWR